jgi:hypothetical protein
MRGRGSFGAVSARGRRLLTLLAHAAAGCRAAALGAAPGAAAGPSGCCSGIMGRTRPPAAAPHTPIWLADVSGAPACAFCRAPTSGARTKTGAGAPAALWLLTCVRTPLPLTPAPLSALCGARLHACVQGGLACAPLERCLVDLLAGRARRRPWCGAKQQACRCGVHRARHVLLAGVLPCCRAAGRRGWRRPRRFVVVLQQHGRGGHVAMQPRCRWRGRGGASKPLPLGAVLKLCAFVTCL